MADKTQTQTYKQLTSQQNIVYILNQPNITSKEKIRHGGKTFKLIEINDTNNQRVNHDLSENNTENSETVASGLTDNKKELETNKAIWTKLKNYLNLPRSNAEELIQTQRTIIEKEKEIQQLKNEIELLKQSKQSNVNFDKFKYNAVTIYDEKQRKNTGIEKIYEEILSINNEFYFITTFQHINNSITEEIIYFHQLTNGNVEVIKQLKKYKNINQYKHDLSLIEEKSNYEKNIKVEPVSSVKDFLKQQQDFKLKPNKKEWKTWCIIIGITLFIGVVVPICTFAIPALIPTTATVLLLETKIIIAVSFAVVGLVFKEISSLFENATQKVKSWFKNKYFKSKDQKEKEKKERQSIIKNLTSDKLETKLKTQYDILKQELDNRKDKKADEIMSNETTNHSSNSTIQNSSIELENNQDFDSSIRNTVNHHEQPPTISKNNWDKVKCLLT